MTLTAHHDTLDIAGFFNGTAHGWGLFRDRFGRLRRRFSVVAEGAWENDTFVLHETFHNDDDQSETRDWRIRPSGGHRFTASAGDVVGEADGTADGPTVSIRYRWQLKTVKRTILTDVHDKMVLIDQDTVIGQSSVSKWGVNLGEAVLMFRRGAARP